MKEMQTVRPVVSSDEAVEGDTTVWGAVAMMYNQERGTFGTDTESRSDSEYDYPTLWWIIP